MNKYNQYIFDSHIHMDSPRYVGRNTELVNRYIEHGINRIVIPAIYYESNITMREMFPDEEYGDTVYFAAGIHPHESMHISDEKFWTNVRKQEFEMLLCDKRTVAIKAGLEYTRSNMPENEDMNQVKCFNRLLKYANDWHLPVVLHIRECAELALEMLKKTEIIEGAVAHCYSYGPEITEQFLKLWDGNTDGDNSGHAKMMFGIGGKVTYPEQDELHESVCMIPLDRILLETDGPYVLPYGIDKEEGPNTSFNLIRIAEEIGKLKSVSVETVLKTTYDNACRFYNV